MTPGREGACVGEKTIGVCVRESVCVCVCVCVCVRLHTTFNPDSAKSGWRINAPGGITIRIS